MLQYKYGKVYNITSFDIKKIKFELWRYQKNYKNLKDLKRLINLSRKKLSSIESFFQGIKFKDINMQNYIFTYSGLNLNIVKACIGND